MPQPSRISPAEAAFYLGIPNLIMVRYKGRPALPCDQFALPLRALKRVVWSVVGAGGHADEGETEHVLAVAARHPNVTGVMLDDLFAGAPEGTAQGDDLAVLSLDTLRELRSRLSIAGRRLDLWAVVYQHQLGPPLAEHLGLLDRVSLWTWDAENLARLEDSMKRLEALAPGCGKVLGCYMWDYEQKEPLPLDLMRHQCALGLEWLQTGRIEGLILLASCICDLELESVEWARDWIDRVGDQPIGEKP